MKAKIEVCGYKAVPAGVCGVVQGHTERDHGGIKCSAEFLTPLKFLGLLPCCSNFRHSVWYRVLHKQTRQLGRVTAHKEANYKDIVSSKHDLCISIRCFWKGVASHKIQP
jgi:hypothetical protein